jgi:hypothetical protein
MNAVTRSERDLTKVTKVRVRTNTKENANVPGTFPELNITSCQRDFSFIFFERNLYKAKDKDEDHDNDCKRSIDIQQWLHIHCPSR